VKGSELDGWDLNHIRGMDFSPHVIFGLDLGLTQPVIHWVQVAISMLINAPI
jgi:hypothetical protein